MYNETNRLASNPVGASEILMLPAAQPFRSRDWGYWNGLLQAVVGRSMCIDTEGRLLHDCFMRHGESLLQIVALCCSVDLQARP